MEGTEDAKESNARGAAGRARGAASAKAREDAAARLERLLGECGPAEVEGLLSEILEVPFEYGRSGSRGVDARRGRPLSAQLRAVLECVAAGKGFSVSKILETSMSAESRAILEAWKRREIRTKHAGDEHAFYAAMGRTKQEGHQFHAAIYHHLRGEPLPAGLLDSPEVRGFWDSIYWVLEQVTRTHLVEGHLMHAQLFYNGFFDCVINLEYTPSTYLPIRSHMSPYLASRVWGVSPPLPVAHR